MHRAIERSRLPLGAIPGVTKGLEDYPFHHDAKNFNVFWDVRKVQFGVLISPEGFAVLGKVLLQCPLLVCVSVCTSYFFEVRPRFSP